ncbi:deoxyuridine triphosphatase [Aotine betaherpesvirus 1]|uniref:Deoxyuridine triphosphatase n=1 Tax=Aotine betaherpesvirus 1 TaxID=50290 RepID=G8XUD7_9BETA|nr:deoxyuridine triphosphatase [Aotine betaherpesvirus 1]AEV80767.1 deoxyuridine triphosphatase [Aotine betaherpesvirus 1]
MMVSILTDRLSHHFILSSPRKSRLQPFFKTPLIKDETAQDDGEQQLFFNLRFCIRSISERTAIHYPLPASAREQTQRKIPYKWTPSSFFVKQHQTRLTFFNKHIVWLSEDRNTTLPLGVDVYIPTGHFAITFYRCLDLSFICMADLIESGLQTPKVQIVNLTDKFQAISPYAIEGDICVFPCLLPEPWQVINLPQPTDKRFFLVKLQAPVILEPGQVRTIFLDIAYLYPFGACALIFGTRHFNRTGVLIRPTIWLPGTVATVTVANISNNSVRLTTQAALVKIVFTSYHFAYLLVDTHPIGQIIVPPVPEVGFTHTPDSAFLKQLSASASASSSSASPSAATTAAASVPAPTTTTSSPVTVKPLSPLTVTALSTLATASASSPLRSSSSSNSPRSPQSPRPQRPPRSSRSRSSRSSPASASPPTIILPSSSSSSSK